MCKFLLLKKVKILEEKSFVLEENLDLVKSQETSENENTNKTVLDNSDLVKYQENIEQVKSEEQILKKGPDVEKVSENENTEENVSLLEDNSEIKETYEKGEGEKSSLVENLDSVKSEKTSEFKETESTFFDLLNSGAARNEETTEEKVAVLDVSSVAGNSAKKVLQANANVANLVVSKKPAVFGEEASDDESGSDNEEGVVYEWEVDYILDRKKVENVTYYKVKWKGYDEVFTTWEVIERIPHPEQFITNYEENLKKSPNVIAA